MKIKARTNPELLTNKRNRVSFRHGIPIESGCLPQHRFSWAL